MRLFQQFVVLLSACGKLRRVQSDVAELRRHALVFDELING